MNHEHPDIESQQTAADAAATAGVNDELERLRAEVEQVRADALRAVSYTHLRAHET